MTGLRVQICVEPIAVLWLTLADWKSCLISLGRSSPLGILSAWIVWRRTSDSALVPQLGRGLLVLGCLLVVLFPAISISDDLSQVAFLTEGKKLPDFLEAADRRHLDIVHPAVLLIQSVSLCSTLSFWRDAQERSASVDLFSWNPNIDKRPPPGL